MKLVLIDFYDSQGNYITRTIDIYTYSVEVPLVTNATKIEIKLFEEIEA